MNVIINGAAYKSVMVQKISKPDDLHFFAGNLLEVVNEPYESFMKSAELKAFAGYITMTKGDWVVEDNSKENKLTLYKLLK